MCLRRRAAAANIQGTYTLKTGTCTSVEHLTAASISLMLHLLPRCDDGAGAERGDAEAGLLQGSSWGEKRPGALPGLAAGEAARHHGGRIL